jgi:hypothetical protein
LKIFESLVPSDVIEAAENDEIFFRVNAFSYKNKYRVITKEMTEIKHVLLSHGVT